MCQPQKLLKRNFSVPPIKERSNSQELNTLDVKNIRSKNLVANLEQDAAKKCTSNTSNPNLVKIGQQGSHESIVTDSEDYKRVLGMGKRRNSYESLDVIDGRAMTPVTTTARQRLLKVNRV